MCGSGFYLENVSQEIFRKEEDILVMLPWFWRGKPQSTKREASCGEFWKVKKEIKYLMQLKHFIETAKHTLELREGKESWLK